MESLEKFFNDNDRGYPRDPRRMAYAKLKKNIQGMDREQLEAFIKANLFIPHSQYKMALGNLIQFLNKQDQMNQLSEVEQLRKLAGLLKEDDYSEDPSSDMDDESQSGDTDVMGIDEVGNVKGIKIDIPENTDYKELARAVAKVLIDDYGAHNYKPFLQALISELK